MSLVHDYLKDKNIASLPMSLSVREKIAIFLVSNFKSGWMQKYQLIEYMYVEKKKKVIRVKTVNSFISADGILRDFYFLRFVCVFYS